MIEPTLIIMAAGMGSRYGGLKQIEPISDKGEIILDFSLYDAMMAGFKKAIFVIKKENELDFRKLIDDNAGKHMEIRYAYQELSDIPKDFKVPEGRIKPWGTCHAVLSCRNLIDGPFAVINADDYYGTGAFGVMYDYLIKAKDDEKYKYCMIGYEIEHTLTEHGYVSRGVCQTTESGILKDINERTKIKWLDDNIVFTEDEGKTFKPLKKGTIVSMNFWGFTASMMKEMEARFPEFLSKALIDNPIKGEYFLPVVVDELIKEDKAEVKVLTSRDMWYGVTYIEDKELVVNALQSMKDKGIYPDKLWNKGFD